LSKQFSSKEWFRNIEIENPLANFEFDKNICQFTLAATIYNILKITPPQIQVFASIENF